MIYPYLISLRIRYTYIVYVQCMCEVYDANTLSSTMCAAEYLDHVGCDAVLLGM